MSVAFQITVVGDGGYAQLDELLTRAENVQAVNEVMGRAGANVVKKNFVELDRVGNAMGGERTHYYGQAAASTFSDADREGATISIAQIGIRLIWQGGTVRPVVKKLLAIPAIPEAHGRHPSEFENLKLQWGRGKEGDIRPIALVEKELGAGTTQTAKGMFKSIPVRDGSYQSGIHKGKAIHPRWHGGGKEEAEAPRVFFWLSLEAHISPHPETLPSEQEIIASATDAAGSYLLRHNR
jgi:hypothetical protein